MFLSVICIVNILFKYFKKIEREKTNKSMSKPLK